MSQPLTRRGLVAAAPAAVVAASLPAIAATSQGLLKFEGTHPDAELLALREPFEQTWRVYSAALDKHSEAEASAWSLADLPAGDSRLVAAEERHDAAESLVDSTGDANREIVEEMCRRPARTIEGLAFKAKVSLEHEDNRYEELVTSIMDDILAMGGSNA